MYNESIYEARQRIEYKKACKDFYEKRLKWRGEGDIIKWDEGKHPRDEDGRFTSGGTSATGSNTLNIKGFANKQKLNNHWNNGRTHKDEYKADGIKTAKQYEQRAVELLESGTNDNVLGHMDKSGNIIRYDKVKNDFVKGNTQKGVFTMYKPDNGQKYYDEQREEDLKHGGKA